jgi:tungstate transport system permease protein
MMGTLGQAFAEAGRLLVGFDRELLGVVALSLRVTLTAVLIASAIGMPLGTWLAVSRFRHRRVVVAVLNGLMGLPPVVVGLLVYLLLTRAGPFGGLGLLFSPTAMVIAQVLIVTPIVASLAHQSMRDLWADYHDLLLSLNASARQRIATLLWDGRRALLTAALAGFGRAIGEVGAILLVGGNIEGATRTLTTAIALETARGDFALALALGLLLIALAIGVNLGLHMLARTERDGRW